MLKIAVFTVNPLQENTYIIYEPDGECVVVDPGCVNSGEDGRLIQFIEKNNLKLKMVVATHGHVDHIAGVDALKSHFSVPFAASLLDKQIIDMAPQYAAMFGFGLDSAPTVEIDLNQVTEILLGENRVEVIPTPGHSQGQVTFWLPEEKVILPGDTLFRERIGRSDLPGGDYSQLMNSILKKILPLGDDVQVLPGHGPASTIGHEALYNPFITEVVRGEIKY
jgi:glyoxylase-like metal-dependent hydrolase (beta-lactamase superfamily II)